MTKLTTDEQTMFLTLCKQVRECQETYGTGEDHTFHITNIHTPQKHPVKKQYALVYSLERKGFVKVNGQKCVSIAAKGNEYVQYLRSKLKGAGEQ